MTPAELIEVYGADAARWPAEHRDAARAAIAGDAVLQRALADAAALDAMLDGWAQRGIVAMDSDALTVRIRRPAPRWPRVAGVGGLIAAAVAAVVWVSPPTLAPAPVAPTNATADAAAAVDAADDAVFAQVFTPTPDEETLI